MLQLRGHAGAAGLSQLDLNVRLDVDHLQAVDPQGSSTALIRATDHHRHHRHGGDCSRSPNWGIFVDLAHERASPMAAVAAAGLWKEQLLQARDPAWQLPNWAPPGAASARSSASALTSPPVAAAQSLITADGTGPCDGVVVCGGDDTPPPIGIPSPAWLPQGWVAELHTRRTGTTAGTRDKYYKDLVSGRRFRSRTEVFNFIETGKGRIRPSRRRKKLAFNITDNHTDSSNSTALIKITAAEMQRPSIGHDHCELTANNHHILALSQLITDHHRHQQQDHSNINHHLHQQEDRSNINHHHHQQQDLNMPPQFNALAPASEEEIILNQKRHASSQSQNSPPYKLHTNKKAKIESLKKAEAKQASRLWQWLHQPVVRNHEQILQKPDSSLNAMTTVLKPEDASEKKVSTDRRASYCVEHVLKPEDVSEKKASTDRRASYCVEHASTRIQTVDRTVRLGREIKEVQRSIMEFGREMQATVEKLSQDILMQATRIRVDRREKGKEIQEAQLGNAVIQEAQLGNAVITPVTGDHEKEEARSRISPKPDKMDILQTHENQQNDPCSSKLRSQDDTIHVNVMEASLKICSGHKVEESNPGNDISLISNPDYDPVVAGSGDQRPLIYIDAMQNVSKPSKMSCTTPIMEQTSNQKSDLPMDNMNPSSKELQSQSDQSVTECPTHSGQNCSKEETPVQVTRDIVTTVTQPPDVVTRSSNGSELQITGKTIDGNLERNANSAVKTESTDVPTNMEMLKLYRDVVTDIAPKELPHNLDSGHVMVDVNHGVEELHRMQVITTTTTTQCLSLAEVKSKKLILSTRSSRAALSSRKCKTKHRNSVLYPKLDLSGLNPNLTSRQRAKLVQKMKAANARELLASLGRKLCTNVLLPA